MEDNLPQNNSRDALAEVSKVKDLCAFPSISDAVARIAADLEVDLAQRMSEIDDLKVQRAGFHGRKCKDAARRRLENAKLKTPYPADRVKSLLAERLAVRGEINTEAPKLFTLLARLELIDAELLATRDVLEDMAADREIHRQTGLYAGSAKFISRLYSQFRVDWMELDALTEDGLAEIAEVIRRRLRPSEPEEA